MFIRKRADHTPLLFFKRTISAQIHFFAFLSAVLGLLALLPYVSKLDAFHFWGTMIFGVTAMICFLTSAVYHFVSDGCEVSDRVAGALEHLDHSAIYLFIAGTYTPVLLNTIAPPWQGILMVGIWSLAIAGIIYTLVRHRLPGWAQSRAVYTSMFVLMGCVLLVRINEAAAHFTSFGIFCLFAGGISYILGAIVYASKRPCLVVGVFGFHELWHVLCSAGFFFHFGMVCSFYI